MHVANPDITMWLQSQASLSSHVASWIIRAQCRPMCCYNQSDFLFHDYCFHDRSLLSWLSTQSLLHIPIPNLYDFFFSDTDNLKVTGNQTILVALTSIICKKTKKTNNTKICINISYFMCTEERKLYRFAMTRGWVNDDRIDIFWVNYHFKSLKRMYVKFYLNK